MHMPLISHEAMQVRVYTFAYICVELLEMRFSLLIKTVAMGTFTVQWKPVCVCVDLSLCTRTPLSVHSPAFVCHLAARLH